MKNKIIQILYEKWIFLLLFLLIIIFSNLSPVFFSMGNASNFFRSLPTLGIVTLGITVVIITGGVDLSCGAVLAFSGTVGAYLASRGFNPIVVIFITLVTGAIFGLLNGFLITKFKLQPFIATLGTNYFIRGLILLITNGIFIKGMPDWFYMISNTKIIFFIYSNTVVFIIISLVLAYMMKNSRFGRYSYLIGSNSEAARLSGINVSKHIVKVYVFQGVLASIAGIIMMSYLNVGAPSEGIGMEAFAIAGAVIGGTQFGGGVGKIGGAIAGVIVIEIFKNGLAILGINSFGQQTITGLIIIIAVVVDFYRKRYMFKLKK